jgi:hypothetical protein
MYGTGAVVCLLYGTIWKLLVFEIITCCMAATRVCSRIWCTRGCDVGLLRPRVTSTDVIQYPTRVAGTGTGLLFAGGYGFIKPTPAGFVPVAIPR